MKKYYVGIDVHQATSVIVVLNGKGKFEMEMIVATRAETLRAFLKQLRGEVHVTFEEGTQATWLYDLLRPLVAKVLVCNPRHHKQSGNKSDRIDARKLAEWLWQGALRPVYHGEKGLRRLKELTRNYICLVQDTTRVMNRLKAIFRGRAISCKGTSIYRPDRQQHWLGKLRESGVKERATSLYEELAALKPLKQAAKQAMLKEARRQPAYRLWLSLPLLGPIRVAQIMAIVETPFRFRNKRQFWTYVGLAVITRMTSEYEVGANGRPQRRRRPLATRGLNRNHNHQLKHVFKSAAKAACSRGPIQSSYVARVEGGMDSSLAQLAIARKLASTTLTVWKTGVPFAPERVKQQVV
jgi:transposase